jgi:hypothetical protein
MLEYVGSARNLADRLRGRFYREVLPEQASRIRHSEWGSFYSIVIKYRLAKKLGEHLMGEYRLINKLKPRRNQSGLPLAERTARRAEYEPNDAAYIKGSWIPKIKWRKLPFDKIAYFDMGEKPQRTSTFPKGKLIDICAAGSTHRVRVGAYGPVTVIIRHPIYGEYSFELNIHHEADLKFSVPAFLETRAPCAAPITSGKILGPDYKNLAGGLRQSEWEALRGTHNAGVRP